MKLISEELQKKLPEGTKIEFISGETNSLFFHPNYNALYEYDNRDKLDKLQVTFSNGLVLVFGTADHKGIIVEEKQVPL